MEHSSEMLKLIDYTSLTLVNGHTRCFQLHNCVFCELTERLPVVGFIDHRSTFSSAFK